MKVYRDDRPEVMLKISMQTGMAVMVSSLVSLSAVLAFVAVPASCSFLVLGNAKIYTVEESKSWAEAVAIDNDGVIASVGSESEVMSFVNSSSNEMQYVDLEQRLVLPGFQDAHLHAVEAGVFANLCSIPEDVNVQDISFIFEECPDGGLFADQGWIVGAGVDVGLLLENLFQDPFMAYPITVLDRSYPDTPVLIIDNIGHGAVANSRAFEVVGYDTLVGNPPGGIIDRDLDTDAPTGIVLENAQQKLRDAAFPPTAENKETAYNSLLDALETLAVNGITSVSDAGGYWRQAQIEAWDRAESNNKLTVRASNGLYVYPDMPFEDQLSELVARYSNNPDKILRFNQAKIYVDGIVELGTAALYEPYLSSLGLSPEDNLGFEYFGNASTLTQVSQTLSNAGFQLHFHVTGDRGAGMALDAIEVSNSTPGPHRLTHVYLVAEQDRPRFAQLNAVADFQLSPSSIDPSYSELLSDIFIGSERAATLLPAIELYEAGALVTISSDWDADVLSPLVKLSTVLTRPDGRSIPDLEAAIQMMTLNPAILLQHDNKTGSIENGKFADLVVIDKDIFSLAPEDIQQAKVLATLFQGDVVYDPQGIIGSPVGTGPPSSTPTTATSDAAKLRQAFWYHKMFVLALLAWWL